LPLVAKGIALAGQRLAGDGRRQNSTN